MKISLTVWRGLRGCVNKTLLLHRWGIQMTKIETADHVAATLYATENAIDTALVQAAQLVQSIIEARKELNVSAAQCEVAQARAAEAIAALSEARRTVMASH